LYFKTDPTQPDADGLKSELTRATQGINVAVDRNFSLYQELEREHELKNSNNLDCTALIAQTNKQIKMMQFQTHRMVAHQEDREVVLRNQGQGDGSAGPP
jgi:hypothetical protein